jgi:hypothetical protein
MHRAVTVAMVLAVLAGSVPAAASLAQQSSSDAEPGASFAGVVGVQESEVNSEVESRSLDQRLNAAGTNESKAGVVANESEQLEQRLAELEAEKARLKQAYENGSISKGEYQARLAVLAAELRSVERQATQTADAAETLPDAALREQGANVSEVRSIAQQANRTGGGEVAQAARNVTGGGVGNGLGNAPPNASERGPPNGSEGGPPGEAGGENATDRKPTDAGAPSDAGNDTGAPGDAGNNTGGPGDAGNETGAPSDAGNETNQPADAGNSSDASDTGTPATTAARTRPTARGTTRARTGPTPRTARRRPTTGRPTRETVTTGRVAMETATVTTTRTTALRTTSPRTTITPPTKTTVTKLPTRATRTASASG